MARILYIILLIFISVSVKAQDKLNLFTDKPGYHAGETIWFRVDVSDSVSKIAYVELLDSANAPVLQDKIKLDNAWGAGSLVIPANLSAGNYLLRGYTNWMKNYGAERFFSKQVTIINLLQSQTALAATGNGSGTLNIDIRSDKPSYKTREKVIVNIPDLKNACISVYKSDSLQSMNRLISTQPAPALKKYHFLKEERGNFITGKVTNIKTGAPVPNANCYLSVVGPVNKFYATTSDNAGNILFELINVYNDNQVVLQAADSSYLVKIDNEFSGEYATITDNTKAVVKGNEDLVDNAVSTQVQLLYNRSKDSVTEVSSDTLPFYGYAEYTYIVDEYVKFSSIEDIFREYIRPIQIYKREGAMVPIMFLDKERRLLNKSPFVLIDNVPVFNMQKLMGINPGKLQRIDVVDRPYWYKKQYYEGIISVFTKNKDPEDYLSRNAIVQEFRGLQSNKIFYSPSYDTEIKRSSRLPDFRSLLYWAADVNSQSIEFYTSDLRGDYIITVQGTDEKGEPASKSIRFKVE